MVTGALAGANDVLDRWAVTTAVLVVAAVVIDQLGRRLCGWALRQPGAGSRTGARPVRRRAVAGSRRGEMLAIDRASVWRSPALRRGLLVLGILPGAVAAVAGLEWPALVLLPGLVAAGAGLLFGVNAFCLDGSGAVWLASLPVRPSTLFWSKSQVVAETCAIAVAITVAAGSLRAQGAPTAGEAAALASCVVVVVLRVVATCMELSVTRPFRADLLGPRDTPAPPGVMAAYSARLAVSTTLVAVLFSTMAEVAPWPWPVVIAAPFCLLSVRRLLQAVAALGRRRHPGPRGRDRRERVTGADVDHGRERQAMVQNASARTRRWVASGARNTVDRHPSDKTCERSRSTVLRKDRLKDLWDVARCSSSPPSSWRRWGRQGSSCTSTASTSVRRPATTSSRSWSPRRRSPRGPRRRTPRTPGRSSSGRSSRAAWKA